VRFIDKNPDFVFSLQDKLWYRYDGKNWVESGAQFESITLNIWEEDKLFFNVHLQNLRKLCRERCAITGGMNKEAEMLLNTEEGVLDLQQFIDTEASAVKSVQPHDRFKDNLITMKAGANYKPGARLPVQFLEFLNQLCYGDAEMANYMMTFMAYCFTGRYIYHYFYLLFGLGRNGKSMFLSFMEEFLGSYFGKIPAEKFSARATEKAEKEVYRNRTKRLVVIDETPDKFKPNTTVVKKLSGGDSFISPSAESGHIYHPHFKLAINTNHLPDIGSDQNVGMWERQKVLITRPPVPKADRIKDFHQILLREKDEVLTYLLENYLQKVFSGGLDKTTPRMELAYDFKRFQQDPVEYFVEKTIRVSNIPLTKGQWIQSSVLFGGYTQFHLNIMSYFQKKLGFFQENESNKLLVHKSTQTAFSLKLEKLGGYKEEYTGREFWKNIFFHSERVWSENGMKATPKELEEFQEQLQATNEYLYSARRQIQELFSPVIQTKTMWDQSNHPVDHFEDPDSDGNLSSNSGDIKFGDFRAQNTNSDNNDEVELDFGDTPSNN
jgi:P4 family phage/plasmid primase-like protien